VDVLFDNLVPFFNEMSLLTRKAIDYKYWAIAVQMFKFGYYCLAEGRQILLQISKATNKSNLRII
jgi:hypothetical protein